ncbi:unnamed protein product [Hyaloperonospora brassicae]|uniref:tRNA synthetases class I catalytic domain-containing protein n=1 Tax=Hyaloperonospora brassicae TaxID=162125 RepID=A0AAV0U261_HYABA|nr:unnamed protein product [Hyaloperonospora brassicae]
MTHYVLGDKLDVHTGRVDFRFPHHNNEIAQCEAHTYSCGHDGEWCKHFVHFGHLYIRGRKMSKSLKNFIGVKDFSEDGHSADARRLYRARNLVYSEDRIRDAEAIVDRLRGFFRSVMVYGNDYTISSCNAVLLLGLESKRCEKEDFQVLDALFTTRVHVDEFLLDDGDTPRALSLVVELVSRLHTEFSARMRRRIATPHKKRLNQSDGMFRWEEQETLLHALLRFYTSVREEALRDPKQSDLAPGQSVVKFLALAEREAALEDID